MELCLRLDLCMIETKAQQAHSPKEPCSLSVAGMGFLAYHSHGLHNDKTLHTPNTLSMILYSQTSFVIFLV